MTTGITCATTSEPTCPRDAISIRNGIPLCRDHRDTAPLAAELTAS